MKLIISFFIIAFFFTACKEKTLSSKYLTDATVVRSIEKTPEVEKDSTIRKENGLENQVLNENGNKLTEQNSQKKETPLSPAGSQTVQARYYLITASFGKAERAKAENAIKKLKIKHKDVTLIEADNRFRISIESFTNMDEANAIRDTYRKTGEYKDCWVFTHKD